MLKLTLIITIAMLMLVPCAYFQPPPEHNYKPVQGYVPDEATAIAIAIAVREPIYGHEQIAKQKPFKAVLVKGVWKVEGSLPMHVLGGVAVAEISKDDGRVWRVSHGK